MTARAFAVATAVATVAPPQGQAQSTAALEAERQVVFAQLLDAPTDRALMVQYARLSVELRDYEAAASTLERLVDLEPANSAIRLELAQAYFAMGAYALAEYHLSAVARDGGAGSADQALVAELREEAAEREAPQRLSGRFSAGLAWTEGSGDSGFAGRLELDWRVDLGGPNGTDWLTQLSGAALAAGNGDVDARQLLRVRSGPELQLDGTAFGPRLQPYLQFTATRGEGSDDQNELLIGLAYQNPHSAIWTSFADLAVGRAENTATGAEIDVMEASIGASIQPSETTLARVTLLRRSEDSPGLAETVTRAQLELWHGFDPGIGATGRDWILGVQLLADQVEITGVAPREDDILSYGLTLRAPLGAMGSFLEAGAARAERRSTIATFDADETVLSLQLGWEF